jgi:branched-chain amino acid transport system permease protein
MNTALVASSLVLAAVYLQVALGWIVVYRSTKVLNFATGQFLLLGALLYSTMTLTLHWPAVVAFVVAALATGAIAATCYDSLMRPLAGRPVFSQIIVTVGLGIMIASVMDIIWGNQPKALKSAVPDHAFHLPGDAVLTVQDLVIIGVSLSLYVALLLFLQRSRPGQQMRAAAELPLLASQSGININRVFRLAWFIAGCSLATAGVAYASLTLVSSNVADLGLAGIAPALIGGLDDVRGAIIGCLVLALVENFAATYLGGDVRAVAPYIVILVVLAVRPYGLFGVPEVRRV